MTDIGVFAVQVEVEEDLEGDLAGGFNKAATVVEKRGKTMTERLNDGLQAAFLASGTFKNLTGGFDDAASSIEERADAASEKVSSTFAKLGVGLVGGFAFDQALNSFDQFAAGATEVLTLLPNQSEAAFGILSNDLLDFQEDLRVTSDVAVPALYQAISAGQTEDPFGFLEVAKDAATGGVTDLTTTVGVLAGTVNAYGDEAVTATRVSDALFTGVRLGVTTFEELAASMPDVTSTAASLGLEIEDVTAAVSALTLKGISTTKSTTFLNQALVELSKTGTQAATTFEELTGGTFDEFIDQGGTLADAMTLIGEAAAEGDVRILDMFGSVEAGRAVLALANDQGQALNATYTEMGSAFGATERAADTLGKTSERTRARIGALLQTALQRFGQQVSPAIGDLLATFEDLVPVVIRLAETLGGTFALGLELAIPAFQGLAIAGAALVQVLSAIPAPAIAGAVAFVKLQSGLALGLGSLLRARTAIDRLGKNSAVFSGLSKAITGFSTISAKALERIPKASGAASKAFAGLRKSVPVLSVAIVAGAAAWKSYQDAQRNAAEDASRFGDAIRANTIPDVTKLRSEIRELISDLGLLSGPEGFGEVDESGEAFLAVLDGVADRGKVFDGVLNDAEGFFDRLTFFSDASGVDDANSALDGLSERLARLNTDTSVLGGAAREYEQAFEILSRAGISTGADGFGRDTEKLAATIAELKSRSDELPPTFAAAINELDRLASSGGLTEGELRAVVGTMSRTGAAGAEMGRQLEEEAVGALNEFRDSGNRAVDGLITQAERMAAASNSATPYADALRFVRDQLIALGDTDADGKIDATGEAIDSSIVAALEAGFAVEDLDEAYADLVGTLTDVEDLMGRILGIWREQFDLGRSLPEAIGEQAQAYRDLGTDIKDLLSTKDLEKLQEERSEATKRSERAEIDLLIAAEKRRLASARESVSQLDVTTESGFAAFQSLTNLADANLGVADAQLRNGATLGEVQAGLRASEASLFSYGTQLGVSESAMINFVNTLDTTPEQIQTLIELVGADASVADIVEVISNLEGVPTDVKAELALLGADASLQDILAVLAQLGIFDQFKPTAEPQVETEAAKARTAEITAELGALDGLVVEPDVKIKQTGTKPEDVEKEVDALNAKTANVEVGSLGDDILAANLVDIGVAVDDLNAQSVVVDIGQAGAEEVSVTMGDIILSAQDLGATDPIVDISSVGSGETISEIVSTESAALDLDAIDPVVEVSAEAGGAQSDIAAFASELNQLDGRVVTVEVRTVRTGGDIPATALGGVFDNPGLGEIRQIGEDGREYVIPVENYRSQGVALLRGAAAELGFDVVPRGSGQIGTSPSRSDNGGGGSVTHNQVVVQASGSAAAIARRLRLELEEI